MADNWAWYSSCVKAVCVMAVSLQIKPPFYKNIRQKANGTL
ncbi:hypothetical protein [Moraxella lacunata]